MCVEESSNKDINVYKNSYYDTHDVNYIELDNFDEV